MKKIFKGLLLSFAVILSVFPLACAKKVSTDVMLLTRFNTSVHVEVYNSKLSQTVKTQIKTLLDDLDGELSATKPNSSITRFNDAEAGVKVTFSTQAIEIINLSKSYYEYTGGKFNFAVYPLAELWGFAPSFPVNGFSIPQPNDIESTKALCNPDLITLDGNEIYKSEAGVKIDLGGIAKGYAVDEIRKLLIADGHTDGYINIGGSSLYILGLKGEDNYFSVRHPRKNNDAILRFTPKRVKGVAVSTSGDYEKYYEVGGKRYCHIIDGVSGNPADTGVVSATILGGSATFTDALTTALCLTERENISTFINGILTDYPDLRFFVFYEKDGVKELITNEKQGEDFTLLDEDFSVVNI